MKQGQTLADKAYQLIKNMFVADQLVGGQKLRYQDLAQRLAMSQTPVIQALNRLELEGLVRSETNKGFFVSDLSAEEADELYDMRAILEVYLVDAVVKRLAGEPEGLFRIRRLLAAHRQASASVYRRERLMADAAFHLGLAELSGHKVAAATLRRVFDSLFLKCHAATLPPGRLETAEQEHTEVVESLAAGDRDKTAEALARHIQHGRVHIVDAMKRQRQVNRSLEF